MNQGNCACPQCGDEIASLKEQRSMQITGKCDACHRVDEALAAERKRLLDLIDHRRKDAFLYTQDAQYGHDIALDWVIQQITEGEK